MLCWDQCLFHPILVEDLAYAEDDLGFEHSFECEHEFKWNILLHIGLTKDHWDAVVVRCLFFNRVALWLRINNFPCTAQLEGKQCLLTRFIVFVIHRDQWDRCDVVFVEHRCKLLREGEGDVNLLVWRNIVKLDQEEVIQLVFLSLSVWYYIPGFLGFCVLFPCVFLRFDHTIDIFTSIICREFLETETVFNRELVFCWGNTVRNGVLECLLKSDLHNVVDDQTCVWHIVKLRRVAFLTI